MRKYEKGRFERLIYVLISHEPPFCKCKAPTLTNLNLYHLNYSIYFGDSPVHILERSWVSKDLHLNDIRPGNQELKSQYFAQNYTSRKIKKYDT